MATSTVTYSAKFDKDIYDLYKSVVQNKHQNVKQNLLEHMKKEINKEYEPNKDTLEALQEMNDYIKTGKCAGGTAKTVDQLFKDILDE